MIQLKIFLRWTTILQIKSTRGWSVQNELCNQITRGVAYIRGGIFWFGLVC